MSFLDRFTRPLFPNATRPLIEPDAAPAQVTPLDAAASGRRYQLNTLGQVCPFPLVEAKQAIEQLEVGDELVIDFDCTQATDSLPHWAGAAGYPVTNFEQVGDAAWTITVQKA